MSSFIWTPHAVSSEACQWRGAVWRMVESQHIASTMKLVDTSAEQDVLESLLESGKPRLPDSASRLDYLLATPFRYSPYRSGSRFRAVTDPGIFYGAGSERTAAAELGFWRWRFLKDSLGLKQLEPVAHTAFNAVVATSTIDLRQPPFDAQQSVWTHPTDYSGTQSLAKTVREADVGAILYKSVRDPEGGSCLALLSPAGFAKPKPLSQQTWFLAVSQDEVIWKDNQARVFAFSFG